VDLKSLAKDLSSSFEVVPVDRQQPPLTSVIGRDIQEKFLVKSDTLRVYLSPIRATMFQKERKPFTENDLKLRDRIFATYRHSRSTPFPFGFLQEPHFEVESQQPDQS